MAITPNSVIHLCNVPFDNTYKNQIYFYTQSEQETYFTTRIKKTFSNYSYVRKEIDGKVHQGIRVESHVDNLAICNYIMYRNTNYTTKWFYAFITRMVYLNDSCTEIYFECDAYQTWRFDITILSSFVEREHSVTDAIGDNLIPEELSFKDYNYVDISSRFTDDSLTTWGYLIASSAPFGSDTIKGCRHSGIYQGLFFYFYRDSDITFLNTFLDNIRESEGDVIQSITCIPMFCVNSALSETQEGGYLSESLSPSTLTFSVEKPPYTTNIDGYSPKNNKCFTSQFFSILVSNNAGAVNEYSIEEWTTSNITFTMYGDTSTNPSIILVPTFYEGIPKNYEQAISLSGFPQCAYNSDTFKLWLSRNQFSLGVSTVADIANITTGVMSGNPISASMGISGIASSIGSIYQHSKDPNKANIGNTKNNLLTACKQNKFSFYLKFLRSDLIQIVDNFFTMFGYKTCVVKVPNMSSRPYFNYVHTKGVNITGAIPNDDMRVIKAMFDNGVTLWKSSATVGDYSVTNI